MKMNKAIIWVALALIFMTSCISQKKAYKTPIKQEGDIFLISQMQENESRFETFKGKALIKLHRNGSASDLKANIRIRKDSAIWVSISAGIGIEAARVLLTHDSVLFLNRLEKTFFVGNYQFISKLINAKVDFDIIQALLTGNDFKWYDYHDLKAKASKDQYQLESTHRRKLKKYIKKNDLVNQAIYQSIWLNPESFKIERIKIKEIVDENKKIDANYSNFKKFEEQLLPTQYDIIISAESDVLIDATLMNIRLNEALKFPFNIPSKYKEISLP